MILTARILSIMLIEILEAAMHKHRDNPAYQAAEDLWRTLGDILTDPLSQNFDLSHGPKTTLMSLANKRLDQMGGLTPELVKQGHPQLIVAIEVALYAMNQPLGDVQIDPLLRAPGGGSACHMVDSLTRTMEEKRREAICACLSAGGVHGLIDVHLRDNEIFVLVVTMLDNVSCTKHKIMHLKEPTARALFSAKET